MKNKIPSRFELSKGILAGLLLFIFAVPVLAITPKGKFMSQFPAHLLNVQPPWNPPIYEGTNITVPGLQNVPDIHGDIVNPQLVIFFAGNQYMLVNQLMRGFMKAYPKYKHVVAFTFPPGRLILAAKRGNGILLGNMHIDIKPDILTAGKGNMKKQQRENHLFSKTETYASNKLAIMVYRHNPKHIKALTDLSNPKIRLCMPNPQWEGIAKHAIIPSLAKAGGQKLVNAVYREKVREGTTFLTHIHHRQTPVRIMQHKCDAGVVWYSEAYFHDNIAHHPISYVKIPDSVNKVVPYVAGMMKSAPHPQAAKDFMAYLLGPKAQKLYRDYGFMKP